MKIRNVMKKTGALLLAAVLFAGLFSGCSKGNEEKESGVGGQKKIHIVTTIFPVYDWVREIVGDTKSADITLLLDQGTDLHSYQPTAKDMVEVSSCDVFIYVGGESDEWVKDALSEAKNEDMVAVNLLEALGEDARTEELVEGMQTPEEHDHEEEGDHEEAEEWDEHIWLSLKNAKALTSVIAQRLSEVNEEYAQAYLNNAEGYIESLDALDLEYQAAIGASKKNTLLFSDRFPFRYLTEDYGLSYYAAFLGCSAETEASFETVRFLSEKTDELGLTAVLVIENSDKKIAQTVVSNTKDKNQKILTMDSLQSVSSEDIAHGASYLSAMSKNLEVLKEALQ